MNTRKHPVAGKPLDVAIWLGARAVHDPAASTLCWELHDDYAEFVKAWQLGQPLSTRGFHQALDAHGFEPARADPKAGLLLCRPGLRLVARAIADSPPTKSRAARQAVPAEVERLRLLLGRISMQLAQGPLPPEHPLAAEIRAESAKGAA